MDNRSIAQLLAETADLLEISSGDPFRIRSYRRAAEAVESSTIQLSEIAGDLKKRRDQLCAGLRAAGLEPHVSAGTYFVNADVGSDPVAWCAALPDRCGVVAIPTSVFYDDKDAAGNLVRFAFCKREQVIAEAARRLATLGPKDGDRSAA